MKKSPIALALACAFGLAAQAQEKPATDTQPKDPEAVKIEKISVSARRREESLEDVPVAVTAFTAADLDKLNVQNLGDLQTQVPNLTIYASRATNTTLTAFIRGIGQADPLWGVDPGVGLYFDDVYMARPQGALLDVFDTQRIEVLRGPQGTLYGKNTIGGAIKYVSRPLSPVAGGSAEVGFGSYDERHLKASLDAAGDDGVWRGRIAVAALRRDGFGTNSFNGEPVSDQSTDVGRVSLGYFPAGVPLTVVASADAANDNSHVRGFQRMGVNAFDPAHTPASTDRYDIASGMPTINFTHNRGAALTATWTPSATWTFKSISSYRRNEAAETIDFDGLPQAIADVSGDFNDRQKTQELQALYTASIGTGVIGAYYFDGSAGGHVFNNFLNLQFAESASTVYTTSTAAYADWNFPLAPHWNLDAGARFTREEKHAVVLNQAFANATFATPIATLANFDKTLTVSNTSPKVSLQYEVSGNTNLYATYSRGFKSGGFNIRANNLAVPDSSHPYLDEKLDSFELGAKFSTADGRFAANAALFHNQYRNVQLSVFTTYTQANGTPGFYGDFTNAGKAHIDGAELELAWRPDRNWNITGFIAGLDAKYDEFISSGVNIASSQKFTNAPKMQVALNVERIDQPGFGGTLRTLVGYSYRTKVYPTTDLSEVIAQAAYGLWSAGVVWERDKHWRFSVNGSNLADKQYRTDGYNIPALHILDGFYGPPRQVMARVSYRY
jgi:iron complex outermembrane receptor protein